MSRRVVLCVVACIALASVAGSTGCKLLSKNSDAPDAATTTDAAPSPTSSAAETTTDGDDPSDAAKPPREQKPLTSAERSAKKSYAKSLVAGRKATLAKDYPEAIAAFDQAVAARPEDPRALSERGYAKLLSKDYDGAQTDLTKAREGTDDAALQSQIYFNIGLVAEGKGEADAARVAFARSNALRASPGAKEKLAGKSGCIARIDKRAVKGTVVTSLSAAWDAMRAAYVKHGHPADAVEKKPATDSALKTSLCIGGCSGEPWFARFGHATAAYVGFVVTSTAEQKLTLYEVADAAFGSCGGDLTATLGSGPVIHVQTHRELSTRVWLKMNTTKPTPCDDQNDDCVSACVRADFKQTDWFIDPTKATSVLSIEESGPIGADGKSKPVLTVKEAARVVDVTGGGCSERVELK